jgi:glycerol-3-phosphate cytidylyltransferase
MGSDRMKRIGYTTGVYDLFHIGHLNIFKRAKMHCDYWIVGVTTDELCKARKNKYPVIPYAERVEIVKSIRYVDEVVPQTSMDKFEAWNRLRFNVMFVGDDWKGTDMWNKLEEQFSRLGVEIIYFPYTQQTSSTKIRSVLGI